MWTQQLSDVLSVEEFGGKAESLSRLISFGVNVPKGFAISKQALIDYKNRDDLSVTFVENLMDFCDLLKSKLLIVRSSAIGEDSKEFSFAGQLDSFVVNHDAKEILEAVKNCWKGLDNDRLLAYSEKTGKKLVEMGVVVQEFVEPDYAGVTFTQSPNQPDKVYTEYVKGRGELLVSGEVTPSNFSSKIDNEKIETDLPFNGLELLKQCERLKDFYGCQLDIEWVAVEQEIYFVQARAITVRSHKKVHWTNTNLNENYPDPISPLLYSIARDSYYHYFKNLAGLLQLDVESIRQLEYDFSNTVGSWGNRIYYNMTSIHNIMSASPLKSYFIDAFNKFVGYKDEDVATSDRSKTTSLIKLVWRLFKLNFRLEKNIREIEGMVSSFSERVKTKHSKHRLFYQFLDLRFHQWYRASLADFFAMIHYKLLGVYTRRFYGSESIGVHNKLVQAIPGLISTEPLNEVYDIAQEIRGNTRWTILFQQNKPGHIWTKLETDPALSELSKLISEYLEKWGYRCSGELMFFKKNYVEEPEKFIELIQSYLRQEAQDPRKVIALKDEERKKAVRDFTKKIIKRRHIFFPVWMVEVLILRLLVKLCMQAISSRERVRYKQAEMYFRFKEVVRGIGRECGLDKDVFYLTYKEIGEMISSSSMEGRDLSKMLSDRKMAYNTEAVKIFPEHFVTNFGERPDHVAEEVEFDSESNIFNGLAASGGRMTGRVKVLDSVLESDKLERGDILVTRQTDPGWAMVFPIIGGLIVERGGALSHGAIVAREFGIPAVVGIAGIADMLADGDEVILDGNLGKVQKINE